jgi:hypothetical protein
LLPSPGTECSAASPPYLELQGAAAQGPCILVHPLENIQEVQLQVAAAAPHADDWDMEEQVVWSSVEVPYLVTHNTVSGGNNEIDMESLSQQGKQL